MLRKLLLTASVLLAFSLSSNAQRPSDFRDAADSLTTLLKQEFGVTSKVKVTSVSRSGNTLDIHFDKNIGDFAWTAKSLRWFKSAIESILPDNCQGVKVANVYCKATNLNRMLLPYRTSNGRPAGYEHVYNDPRDGNRFIAEEGGKYYSKGLSDRYISLWQSHGRYYAEKLGRWTWQRAPLFRTVEDMFTQSFVLPYLIPMLENSGAYVITPRERDLNPYEVIADNDRSFRRSSLEDPDFQYDSTTFAGTAEAFRTVRQKGTYTEKGLWNDAGIGFADLKKYYTQDDNPFTMGTVRQCQVVSGKPSASATWMFRMPERGRYSVYVSYRSLANSSESAHYTVNHMGGQTSFVVNQNRGGGTWIYLGCFEFDADQDYMVVLDNGTPHGKAFKAGTVVTADAVRIGGGMGKIARGRDWERLSEYKTSGMPSYMEGAMYWMQWAGVDSEIWQAKETDYVNDYASRGAWTEMMKKDKDIPIDMSLGFHSDAGVTPNDSIVGTLSIYTLLCDRKSKTESGIERITSRHLCDLVQGQVCDDIRAQWNPDWMRRQIWDRSYSESRTSGVPAMLLELLSHQNFGDMKYGLDPGFKFTVSRAVYKGVLKFLSDLYGAPYAVQPLPVSSFSAVLADSVTVSLNWKATEDELEPTAKPKGYLVYQRVDGQAWRLVKDVRNTFVELPLEQGRIYSYKVAAYNDGGKSFDSESLSVSSARGNKGTVLIVNNFDRVATPTWFDGEEKAGFRADLESGVPDRMDISYIGEMYDYVRCEEWESDDNPGFGATDVSRAGFKPAGNSFDYPYVHGKALAKLGHSFTSMSRSAFEDYQPMGEELALDIVCGKQVSTPVAGKSQFQVMPEALRNSISKALAAGSGLIVSGAHLASDLWSWVYAFDADETPAYVDTLYQNAAREFVQGSLGFTSGRHSVDTSGIVRPARNARRKFDFKSDIPLWNELNEVSYSVESGDIINPVNNHAATVMRYSSGESAAVFYNGEDYRTACFGFPLESMRSSEDMDAVFRNTMIWLRAD